MKKLLTNNKMAKNILVLFIFFVSTEITFRLINAVIVFDVSLIRIAFGCLFASIIISYLISWFKPKLNRFIICLVGLIFTIYTFLQLGFNHFIGVYMSFNTSSQLGAVTDYIREFILSFLPSYYFIFIPLALLIIYEIFIDRLLMPKYAKKFALKKRTKYEYQVRTLATSISLIIVGFLYYGSLTIGFMQNEFQTISNKDLFVYPSNPSIVINEFGVLGFGFLDVKSLYIDSVQSYIIETNNKQNETDRKFDDTLWLKAIEQEDDTQLSIVNKYLINNTITDYNEYTSYFEGKNLIVIMLESVNDIMINEEYYPNFYKMYSEGWHFANNYSPRNSCSTGNNEFSAMTGLHAVYNSCTTNKYIENTYSSSIFNLFKNAGYSTSSMHNYTEHYYKRSIIHKNLGSDIYYGIEDLDIAYSNLYRNWSSDAEFIDVAMDITLDDKSDEPFMLWLTTVTSHQPYNLSCKEGDLYLDLFADTDYPKTLQRYMSKLKILDNGLGILLERLEEAEILEDTVIVMFGDHYPYGLPNETINYVLDYDLEDYEVERTPFIIYNSEMEATTFDQYTTFINVTPTLANLFGLEFDPRLYMGDDLFNDNYQSLAVFADGSWKNEYAYYDASASDIIYYTDFKYTIDEVKNINATITNEMQISNLIIKNNYFAKLEDKIDNIIEEDGTLATTDEEGDKDEEPSNS